MPGKFRAWRTNQDRAIVDGVNCDKRYLGQMAPPGFGKSPNYMAQSIITGERTMILTQTKGLQDQLMEDFEECGLVSIKGKSSYQCESNPANTCEEGCAGKCSYKSSSLCPWSAAKFAVMESQLCVTNYSCMTATLKYGTGFGLFDKLVLDEAHNAPDELAKAMQVQLSHHEIEEMLSQRWPEPREREDLEAWKYWASAVGLQAQAKVEELAEEIKRTSKPTATLLKDYRHMNNLRRKLADLSLCKPEKWVFDEYTHGFQFDPVDPSDYGERVLFNKVPKILLTSATMRPKTLAMLGIPLDEADFIEYPSSFKASRSPIYYVANQNPIKINRDMGLSDLKRLVERMDEIISMRLDRKGIIQVPSFKLRDAVMNFSKYGRMMISNYTREGDKTADIVERFKRMQAPAYLVSPSVPAGYDFHGDTCRFQIILKLPFPNESSKVDQRRKELDPLRGLYRTTTTLEQQVGRGQRSDDDWQEVFITDDNFSWFSWKAEKFMSANFRAKYRAGGKVYTIPAPPDLDMAA